MEVKTALKTEFDGNTLRAFLSGEIDHHTAVGVRSGIDAEILAKRPNLLALDFSNVSLMDSSGLGLIMGRYSLMSQLGGEVVIERPNPTAERIIRLGGIEKIVKIVGDIANPKVKFIKKTKRGVNVK